MERMITAPDGSRWRVTLTGRITQYTSDELGLTYERIGEEPERRFVRFSPRGAKSGEIALAEASEGLLTRLLRSSQPGWTAPQGGYRRQ